MMTAEEKLTKIMNWIGWMTERENLLDKHDDLYSLIEDDEEDIEDIFYSGVKDGYCLLARVISDIIEELDEVGEKDTVALNITRGYIKGSFTGDGFEWS